MKLLKSNWIFGLVMALTLSATSISISLAKDFGGGMKGVFKELNLSPEQKEKLKKLREESKDSRKDERDKMKAEKEAFRNKMGGDASDDDLRKDFAKLQEKRNEMAKSRFDHMLKVRSILTPEQRKKFAELADKKMEKHKGKHGKKLRNHTDEQ